MVQSIDAGVKLRKRVHSRDSSQLFTAIHTMLNENKMLVGQWCGGNSAKELVPAFYDLRRRFERLPPPDCGDRCGNHCQVLFSDNPPIYRAAANAAFSGLLGKDLHPGDTGHKQDLYHLVQRFVDSYM